MSHPTQTKTWANFLNSQKKEYIEIENNEKYFLVELKNWHNLVRFGEINMADSIDESDLKVFKEKLSRKVDFLHIEPELGAKIESNNLKLTTSIFRNYYLYTSRIDLSLNTLQIFGNFNSSNKNNYNKASKTCEFISFSKPDISAIAEFYNLYSQSRDGIYIGHSKEYFENQAKLTDDNLLCFCQLSDKSVATAWIKLDKENNVAYYLYGGKDKEEKLKGISVFLHFEIMKYVKSLGFKLYDFCGIIGKSDVEDPAWAGFTQFKLLFGGSKERLENEKDLVLNKVKYQIFRFIKNLR